MAKALTELVAVLVIVAITLALILAAIWFIYSMYLAATHERPAIRVSYAEVYTNGTVVVWLYNEGYGGDKLIRVEAVWWERNVVYQCTPQGGSLPLKLGPGPRSYVITLTCFSPEAGISPGDGFRLRLYFETSGVAFYDTYAKLPP